LKGILSSVYVFVPKIIAKTSK